MRASKNARCIPIFLRFLIDVVIAYAVLPAWREAEAQAPGQVLWQIGKEDGSHFEFAEVGESVFGASDYGDLFPKDVHFTIGRHRDADWSPVHPGPADYWAGGKSHEFTIDFDYEGVARPMAFSIILVDAHYARPPRLSIDFNGLKGKFVTTEGTGMDRVSREPKRGRRQTYTLYVPTKFVRKGNNTISLQNTEGSWLFYDCLKLVAPDGEPPCVIPVDVACSPRLDSQGKAVILLDGNIFYWGKPMDAWLEAFQKGEAVKTASLRLEEGTIPVRQTVPAGPETQFMINWDGHHVKLEKAEAMNQAEIRAIESYKYFARMASLYPGNSFYSYASLQTARVEGDLKALGVRIDRRQPPVWEQPPRREADLYSMTTGLLSIQESLQLDVMLRGAPLIEEHTIPTADLSPPKTRSLPFDEMLGDKEPQMSPLASMIPEDQYYISFGSVSHLRSFMDFVDTWGEHCLKHYGLRAKKAMTQEKLETQLCVKDIWYARPITSIAVGEIAVTGSHPFIAQGDDVSLIMQVQIRSIFDPAIEKFLEAAKKNRPDAKEDRFSIGRHSVYSLVTEDREISHFRVDLGNQTVISNSEEAIRRIIQTADAGRPSLAKTEDFRYMRSIFEHGDESESGFIYLSESFIRRQIGPKAKIAQARRLQCGTVLKMIANAAILFKHAGEEFPKSLDEMIESQCIDSRYLVCPDGGKYSWEADSMMAVCSTHNRLRYLTPIVELKTEHASEREKKEYERFVERYNRYWRRFFDPVGIRVGMSSSGLTLDTLILPLVENSIYSAVTEFAGGVPVPLSPPYTLPETILSIQSQIPQKTVTKFIRELWDGYGWREDREVLTAEEEAAQKQAEVDLEAAFGNVLPGAVKGVSDTVDVLGLSQLAGELVGEVGAEEIVEVAEVMAPVKLKGSLNFCDAHMLFGIQAAEIGGLPVRGMGGIEFGVGAAAMALNFPMYATVNVTDPIAAERVLSYTAARLARQRPRGGWSDFRMTVYRIEEYRGRKIHVLEASIGPVRLRGFISILGFEAYLTPELSVLKRIIDLAEEGGAAIVQEYRIWGNVAFVVRPKAWNKVKDDFQLAWAATAKEACISNLDELHVLFKYFSDADMPIEQVADRADGTRYFCPEGGEYQYDAERNFVTCTVHGTKQSPRQPDKMREDAAFSRLISGIDQIALTLAFHGEGVRTRVRTNFKDDYRPFGR